MKNDPGFGEVTSTLRKTLVYFSQSSFCLQILIEFRSFLTITITLQLQKLEAEQ